MFKVKNRSNRKSCEICSKLTIKTPFTSVSVVESEKVNVAWVSWKDLSMFYRSRRLLMIYKIGVLKNFAKFTGRHLCWSHFLIKLVIPINCSDKFQKIQRKRCKGPACSLQFFRNKGHECIWDKKFSRRSFDMIMEIVFYFR